MNDLCQIESALANFLDTPRRHLRGRFEGVYDALVTGDDADLGRIFREVIEHAGRGTPSQAPSPGRLFYSEDGMMWKLKNFIFRLTHPSFWLQNYRTCWVWDEWVLDAIETEASVKRTMKYVVRLGGREVWVSNYPYAYGGPQFTESILPSPLARVALREYIMRAELEAQP